MNFIIFAFLGGLFCHPSEQNYTYQAAQFDNFLNSFTTLLNDAFDW